MEVSWMAMADDYEVICACGGQFTVRLSDHRYGCVRCCTEIEVPPLWLDAELEDLDAMEAEANSYIDGWRSDDEVYS
jgi:hypothetical protein